MGFSRWIQGLVAETERRAYACGIRPGGTLRLPDFLGIGGQKAGTTWLHANLACHPDLFLATPKELHYFNRGYRTRLRDYARFFAAAGDKVAGEITPAYQLLPVSRIRMIRALCPTLRLILLVRDPIDRAWSQAKMALALNRGRSIAEVPDAEYVAFFRSQQAVRRGSYAEAIDRWSSVFGTERVLVLFYDAIAANPEGLLTRAFGHLGVTSAVDWTQYPLRDVVLRGLEAPLPGRFRGLLTELFAAEIHTLATRYGDPAASW